jgi:hypothetical protein
MSALRRVCLQQGGVGVLAQDAFGNTAAEVAVHTRQPKVTQYIEEEIRLFPASSRVVQFVVRPPSAVCESASLTPPAVAPVRHGLDDRGAVRAGGAGHAELCLAAAAAGAVPRSVAPARCRRACAC